MNNASVKIGPMIIRPQVRDGVVTGKYFLDVPARLMPSGVRKRKLFDTKKSAVDAARQLKGALEMRDMGVATPAPAAVVSPLFKELSQAWLEHENLRVRTLKKRSSSLEADVHRLKSLLPIFGNSRVPTISGTAVSRYQERRLAMGRTPATVNSEIRTLMKILRWAQREKLITEVPRIEQIPEPLRTIDIPSPEEVGRLIEALPPSAKPLVWFMAETGCRSGEAFNLTWDCVDLEGGWVEFRAKEGWTPKTRQSQRRVPLSESLRQVLGKETRVGPYVFPSPRDPNKPRDNVRRALESAVERVGLERQGQGMHITPHVLRKAFATWQAQQGTPPRVLQALLGHAAGTRVTDQHYVQATEEAKRKAVGGIHLPVG